MRDYPVRITEKALGDMTGIYDYIAVNLQSPENAIGQYKRIADRILGLGFFPEKFRLVDFEPESDQLFQDISIVLSKDNMIKIADELKSDSGYTFKGRLLHSLVSLMDKYDIPREDAMYYANRNLNIILCRLPEIAPEKYDRYFQRFFRR